MKKIEKYLTKKNIFIGQAIIMGITVLTAFYVLLTTNKFSNLDGFGSFEDVYSFALDGMSGIHTACNVFYLILFLLVIMIAVRVYRYIKMKDIFMENVISIAINGIALFLGIYLLTFIGKISDLTSLNWDRMLDIALDIPDFSGLNFPLIIFVLLLIVSTLVSGYYLFINQELPSISNSQAFTQHVKNTDMPNIPNASTNQSFGELKNKFNDFSHSKKGKKQLIISGSVGGIILAGIIGFNVYNAVKKTPIDLVSACEVTFAGIDESGYAAKYNCNPDFDRTNESLTSFINDVSYSIENDGSLFNGEEVKIVANYSEETAKSLKIKVIESEKIITVSGLQEVYKRWSDISKDDRNVLSAEALEAAQDEAKNEIYHYFSDETIIVNNVEQVAVFYVSKDDGNGNADYLFKANITSSTKEKTENHTEYYLIRFHHLKPNTEGERLDADYSKNIYDVGSNDNDTDFDVVDMLQNSSYYTVGTLVE